MSLALRRLLRPRLVSQFVSASPHLCLHCSATTASPLPSAILPQYCRLRLHSSALVPQRKPRASYWPRLSLAAAVSPALYNPTRRTALHTAMAYAFPKDKIQTAKEPTRTPLVLISCGSFSPITYLHLRMFEMVKDWVKENTQFEVVAGYLSPVSDAYKKVGLAYAEHRINMCRLATKESSWIMVDDWEASKPEYTRTAIVLDHFEQEINQTLGGILHSDGNRQQAKIALMSGADLIETMSNPGVWSQEDLDHILGKYGAFIIERSGTDLDKALSSLSTWRSNIYPIPQLIQNDVSSTKVRQFLRKDMSIRYLIPEPALKYIDETGLFKEESPPRSLDGSTQNNVKGVHNGASSDGTTA